MTCMQNVKFVLLLATAIDIELPLFSEWIYLEAPSIYGPNIVEKGTVVFR